MTRKALGLIAAALLIGPCAASAVTVTKNFVWTGTAGYSMTGYFTYDSASTGDGAVRDGEVTFLFFQGLLNGVAFSSNSTAHTLAGFNFNFNPVANQFFLGMSANSDSGQQWNYPGGSGLGFVAGGTSSALTVNQVLTGNWPNPSTLRIVPEPGSLALLGLGFAGLGLSRRRLAS